ncbi:MAG TPA: PQQ-dependent dehydrogenase, methanol/ethanol family [Gemmatimonadales bacterium]|nr:PQQ-dependent dehydrogenase, methanol/ethanol family [Gemmatimonadales bacterium]
MRAMTLLVVLCLGLGACSGEPSARVVDDAALADLTESHDWLAFGRTYHEQRHSPLTQINDSTVRSLGVAWYMDLPNDRTLYGTPLVVDGVMYFEGSYNVLRAVDAATGKLLWEFDPEVTKHAGNRLRVMWDASRGVAFWKGKVYVATVDGRLIAVDAGAGTEIWSTMTVDPALPLYITGAPKAFRGLVVIGNGGTEDGPIRGYLDAYDAETGERVWRWYTVPGNPADGFENDAMTMAAATWTGEWWRFGGGGTVWHAITYDPDFDQLIFGTGNGAPWNRKIRSPGGGDNLFLCSVVALDATTGEYRWHYQTVPGETWDYNSNMDIVLADLTIEGRPVKAALHAPKNGFFYVLNRENGKLLSAEPFVEVTWATGIDSTGRPIEVAGARYEDGDAVVSPSALGGHSWHAMSYNPGTGLVYIPAMEFAGGYSDKTVDIENWESPNWRFDAGVDPLTTDVPPEAGTSSLKAWDPVAQRVVWEAPKPGLWNAGTLTTTGNLVFQGQGNGRLVAHRATDGEVLWSFDLGLGISAPPITYSVGDRQYVAILVGWGGAGAAMLGSLSAQDGWAYRAQMRRLVTFALDGAVELPAQAPPGFPKPLVSKDFRVDATLVTEGQESYVRLCWRCHGPAGVSGGTAPDLRASPILLSKEAYLDVVLRGSRQDKGMPGFPNLDEAGALAVQHYVRSLVPKVGQGN